MNLLVPNCVSEPNNLSLKILAKALIEKGNAFRHEWAILKNNSELPYILMNASISKSSEQTLSDKISDYLLNIETEISNNHEQKSEMDAPKEATPKPFQISTFSFRPQACAFIPKGVEPLSEAQPLSAKVKDYLLSIEATIPSNTTKKGYQ